MEEPIVRLRIELEGTSPVIWREVDVPLMSSLKAISTVIIEAMGWLGYHLHEFDVAGKRYGVPSPAFEPFGSEVANEANIRLSAIVDRGIKQFQYVYDFGDDWLHTVSIGEVRAGAPEIEYPAYVSGEYQCPPEDVGGIYGFYEFLEAIEDPAHERHEELLEWHGGLFDPKEVPETQIRLALKEIAKRRRGGARKGRVSK